MGLRGGLWRTVQGCGGWPSAEVQNSGTPSLPPLCTSEADVGEGPGTRTVIGVLTAQCDISPAHTQHMPTLKGAETWPVCTVQRLGDAVGVCLWVKHALGGSGDDASTNVSHFNVFSLRPCVPSERVYIALKRCILRRPQCAQRFSALLGGGSPSLASPSLCLCP